MQKIKIGLIDFGRRSTNLNSMLKLQDVVEYAVIGDQLGFDKFWLGEHHLPKTTLPWNNPTNLVPILAAKTQKICIGTAGTLICIHNPYHTASTYKFYNNIFPNRIDLGFANGMPYNSVCLQSTGQNHEETYKNFDEKVVRTIALLRNEEELFRNEGVILPPYKGLLPNLWTLGNSDNSLNRALALGTNLCIWTSNEFKIEEKTRIDLFKKKFYELHGRYPDIRSVVVGICHPSARKAKQIAESQEGKDKLPHGDVNSFYEFIQSYRTFYGLHDFMFFNGILDPNYRLSGIEKLMDKLKES